MNLPSRLQPLLENLKDGCSHYPTHRLQTMCVQFTSRQATLQINFLIFFYSEVTGVYEPIRGVSEWRGCTSKL